MNQPSVSHRDRLRTIAIDAMRARGLDPDFPPDARAAAAALTGPAETADEPVRDLRDRLWCSIDNDESRDLDQLSVAEPGANDVVKILVAIADVDVEVRKGSPIDRHAAANTTSVYTPAVVFPMLPEKLSTDLTSLADQADRLAIVIEFSVAADGSLAGSDIYGARVRNRAKLAYSGVDAWLTGAGPLPPAAAAVPGMDAQLRIQDRVAQALSQLRHQHGALDLDTADVETVFDGDTLREQRPQAARRAMALIENLMVAANGVTATFLAARGVASLRRVVRQPERWDRIVALAASFGTKLPPAPDAPSLAAFLTARRSADPASFPELSHTVVRLLGPGEYVVDPPGGAAPGHFGLAVKDYTHSTAPNRRFPDLITQRLLKAALANRRPPYSIDELQQLAVHCTAQEDAANRVERQVRKSAAAMLVESRVGQEFTAVVAGASEKGTFVKVFAPPIEGMLVGGGQGLDVGDQLRVRLARVDVDRGFIDFAKVGSVVTARRG